MTTLDKEHILALQAAIALDPESIDERLILADVYEQADQPVLAGQQRRIAKALASPAAVKLKGKAVLAVRRAVVNGARCPIVVVQGDAAPCTLGERGYHRFKDGGVCHHPRGALRAGYRIKYVPSTYRIEVGILWLIERNLL